MPLNSGDGRGRSPEGRKSRFVGEEPRSPSLQRGEHVTVQGARHAAQLLGAGLVLDAVSVGDNHVQTNNWSEGAMQHVRTGRRVAHDLHVYLASKILPQSCFGTRDRGPRRDLCQGLSPLRR
jgi:hypothetical protein